MGIEFEFLDAGNGDCIWITTDEGVNILIDGGWSYTYDKKLPSKDKQKLERVDIKTKVKELRDKKKKLDLVVLTHYDNDHIFGISKLIEAETKYKANTVIKEIWFNAFENEKFPIKDKNFSDIGENQIKHETGAKTQKKFEKFIMDIKDYIDFGDLISIDRVKSPIKKGNITLLSPYTDEGYQSTTDITITLLSPNNEKLNKCKKYDYDVINQTGNKKEKDWDKSFSDLLAQIEKKDNSPYPERFLDSTEPNGSSIAFILEYKNEKKYLFLGDAHIDLITDSLTTLGYAEENPLEVEFIKLSHHGSKGNISKKFLSLAKTTKFIILADGNKSHWHPDKETIVRIIDHYRDSKELINFIFNYRVKDIFKGSFPLFKNDELKKNNISINNFKLDCKIKL